LERASAGGGHASSLHAAGLIAATGTAHARWEIRALPLAPALMVAPVLPSVTARVPLLTLSATVSAPPSASLTDTPPGGVIFRIR
jgi:hypothetical protein